MSFRRRREKRTDYGKRLKLVKSGKVRLVIRKSKGHISVQFIEFSPSGDRTLFSAHSSELRKYGWKFSCGNLPSSYLTGLLAGKKAVRNIKEAVLDLGLQMSTKGSRLYAALKGVLDSGISVPHDNKILPLEERIQGKHISKDIENNFNEVKNKIVGGKIE